jgi:phage tail sheath protein FI
VNTFHGIKVTEQSGSAPALQPISTSDIGLVVTSSDADASMFPLNTPVLLPDLSAAIGKAGDKGTAAIALQAINDQVRTPTIVVRVEEGDDEAEMTANVIGATVNGKKTGIQALLAAQAQLGRRPRILGIPGLETQASTAALAIVAQKLRGMSYAAALGEDIAAASIYRKQFSARELMLIYPDFLAANGKGVIAPSYGAARALGLRAAIDATQGWHKTLSNVAVQGVVGITKDIGFDIQDEASEAAILNAAGITACINDDGYRFWGNLTCSDDPQFQFESAVRTAQVLMDTMANGLKRTVDGPLTPNMAKDIIERINALMGQLVRTGRLIGGRAWFDAKLNPKEQLAAGILIISYDYTPVAPMQSLQLIQTITDTYYANFNTGIGVGDGLALAA